jgi:serine/threonine protein kinase
VSPIRPDKITAADLPMQLERFEVLSLLGEGSMARVFHARPLEATGLPRDCALKVLHREHGRRDPMLARALQREGHVGGLLSHPNIVQTYDIGQIGGQPYILMELVHGPTVERLLELRGRLPTPIAVDILEQICRGLHHAHQANDERGRHLGLVHRDLKPSNVILTPDGIAKVMDFGIAKVPLLPGMTTKPGELKGSPRFMSPEQVGGEVLDHRSDLFSLGALGYEMIVGEPLFNSETVHGVWMKIVEVEAVLDADSSFARITTKYPDLARLLRRCLRPDPVLRPGDAGQVADALARFAAELPSGESLRKLLRETPGWLTVRPDGSSEDLAVETFESVPGAPVPRPPPSLEQTVPLPPPRPPEPTIPPRRRMPWLAPALVAAIVALCALGAWVILS